MSQDKVKVSDILMVRTTEAKYMEPDTVTIHPAIVTKINSNMTLEMTGFVPGGAPLIMSRVPHWTQGHESEMHVYYFNDEDPNKV